MIMNGLKKEWSFAVIFLKKNRHTSLTLWQKEIKGTIFGSLNPRADIPRLLGLYRAGQLKLDELITRRYTLDEINLGYQHMRDGVNIRGVITFD